MTRFGDWGSKARELTAITDREGAPYFIKAREAIKKHTMDIEKYINEFGEVSLCEEEQNHRLCEQSNHRVTCWLRTTLTAVAEEARREALEGVREVLVDADSKLSLLRHRGGIKWGAVGMCEAHDVDVVIGKLRSLTK